jgi:hypothetical protein
MVEQSPVELVIKAVQALPDGERDTALGWLIERNAPSWGGAVAQAGAVRAAAVARGEERPDTGPTPPPGIFSRRFGEYGSLHGEHQSVLIRLPVEQHTRLREWCTKHNFSMATVVRGLVDRFLEQQAPGDATG